MTYRRHCVRGVLAACATILLVATSSLAAAAVPAAAGTGLKKAYDPGRVTGVIHGHRPPGPRPASRPELHSRQHRPNRYPGEYPVDHLQGRVDRPAPAAPGGADRGVQVRRRIPRLRDTPV